MLNLDASHARNTFCANTSKLARARVIEEVGNVRRSLKYAQTRATEQPADFGSGPIKVVVASLGKAVVAQQLVVGLCIPERAGLRVGVSSNGIEADNEKLLCLTQLLAGFEVLYESFQTNNGPYFDQGLAYLNAWFAEDKAADPAS